MADGTDGVAVVLTTAGSPEQAVQLARELVSRRLAACVNVLEHACSVFRWKGEVTEENEKVLLIKTRLSLFPRVRDAIGEIHSYDLPEVLMLPVGGGEARYLEWIAESTED